MKKYIPIFISVLLAVAVVTASVLYFRGDGSSETNSAQTEGLTLENNSTGLGEPIDHDSDTLTPGQNDSASKETEAPSSQTTDELESDGQLQVDIDALIASADTVTASGTAYGATKATCVYKFTYAADPQEKPVVREAEATTNEVGLICPQVDIPVVEFSALGTWRLDLTLTSGNSSTIASETITIN